MTNPQPIPIQASTVILNKLFMLCRERRLDLFLSPLPPILVGQALEDFTLEYSKLKEPLYKRLGDAERLYWHYVALLNGLEHAWHHIFRSYHDYHRGRLKPSVHLDWLIDLR